MTRANRWKAGCAAFLLLTAMANAAPSITLSKRIGPPTTKILVSGSGFEPNVGVDIYFDTKDEALVVTNREGEFHHVAIHALRSARPGEHWVTALERNNDKGAQKPFLVQTDWAQFLFGPDHAGLNPYENVLGLESVNRLALQWTSLQNDTAADGSPAIVGGVVYTGCGDGFCAVDTKKGLVLWRHPTGAIYSSPAVVRNSVYVGSDDNNVYAFDARTGALIWSYTTGGAVRSSPAVVGRVVYFGSWDSHVYALNATTGDLLWSYATGSAVESSPAVVNGVAYIASDDGNLYAIDAVTGVLRWSQATGNYSSSSPSVAYGRVYIGSWDGNLYALNSTDGSLLWRYQTGEVGYSSPAVAGGVVYYNAWTGHLYALDAFTGTVLWSYWVGGSSCPAVANGVVYATNQYGVYAFNAKTGALLWSSTSSRASVWETPVVTDGRLYVANFALGLNAYGLMKTDSVEAPTTTKAAKFSALRPDLTLQPPSPSTVH